VRTKLHLRQGWRRSHNHLGASHAGQGGGSGNVSEGIELGGGNDLPESVRCAKLPRVRVDHGAQRGLLQVQHLRHDERLQLIHA
jgi:hypothetical protein